MKHSLAKALLDAGIEHFDTGGTTSVGMLGSLTPQSQYGVQAPTITTQDNLGTNANQLYGQNQDINTNQNTLASQLQQQAIGQGPNPAQNQLAQATGANVSNQAALMAGQRGAGANVGLMARQAAEQGAGIQQAAAGQAATLGAQQQLGAQANLQNLYNQQAQAALQGQGIQQQALAAQNATQTTGQLGASQVNAQTAQQNANNSASTLGGLIGGVGSAVASIFNKGGDVQKLDSGGYADATDPNLILKTTSPGANQGFSQGVGYLGSVIAAILNKGGYVQKLDSGGYATATNPNLILRTTSPGANKGISQGVGSLGSALLNKSPSSFLGQSGSSGAAPTLGVDTSMPSSSDLAAGTNMNGSLAPVSDVSPAFGSELSTAAPSLGSVGPLLSEGGAIDGTDGISQVPGEAEVDGDSLKNDVVPALLSPHEAVLPRSVTMAADAPERAKKFVEMLQDRKGKSGGYGKVLRARRKS
jgi:hypothetical protein